MKTAEEWIDEPRDNRCYKAMSMRNYLSTHESEHDDDEIIEWLKQIQLDAMKEGMRRAATVCVREAIKHDMNWAGSRNCATAILTTAEQLTEKDL